MRIIRTTKQREKFSVSLCQIVILMRFVFLQVFNLITVLLNFLEALMLKVWIMQRMQKMFVLLEQKPVGWIENEN